MKRPVVLAVVGCAILAGSAVADTSFNVSGRDLVVTSEDTGVKNVMTVTQSGSNLIFRDATDFFGMRGGVPPCSPGEYNSGGYPTQYSCPRASFDSIPIAVGGAEDRLDVQVPAAGSKLTFSVAGESGADHLTTQDTDDFMTGDQGNDRLESGGGNDEIQGGDGDDTIVAGPGNDKIQGDAGADTIDAGPGDDDVKLPDGTVDKLTCGEGNDTVVADTIDEVAGDCENVSRQFVAPPKDAPTGDDKKRPTVAAGGSTAQRIGGRRRTIYVAATSNEKGEIAGSGFLDVAGVNFPLRPKSKKVAVAGGGVELAFVLSKTIMRRVASDLRRGRKPLARLKIVATDRAGNTSKPVNLKIRLRK